MYPQIPQKLVANPLKICGAHFSNQWYRLFFVGSIETTALYQDFASSSLSPSLDFTFDLHLLL